MKQELEVIELTQENMESMIYEIRGQRVMLDFDLARIYGYSTKAFNQQVKNNIEKFPDDMMFKLSKEESEFLARSQNLTARIWTVGNKGGRTTYPYAFTEQGIYMLMTVLRGELATKQSLALIRLFKQMKDYIIENRVLLDSTDLIKTTKTIDKHSRDIKTIKHDLKEVMSNFIDPNAYKHFLIMNGEKIEADVAYQTIYQLAKKSIVIVDDYIGVKTLLLLKAALNGIKITIISDNKSSPKLEDTFIYDFKNTVNDSLMIIPNNNRFHDRYILIDHGTNNEAIYHCGASSKDAGNKITTITKIEEKELYKSLIAKILNNEELKL